MSYRSLWESLPPNSTRAERVAHIRRMASKNSDHRSGIDPEPEKDIDNVTVQALVVIAVTTLYRILTGR